MTYREIAERLRYPDDPRMQEIYVQTFEFNPGCTLEIGWHLFGENYERGEFLVRMREELRRHGIAESTELPDHLTHLLALIDIMEREEAALLARKFVLPALSKMNLEEQSPYRQIVNELQLKLEADFGKPESLPYRLPVLQEAACE